jgi:hypothetical protein
MTVIRTTTCELCGVALEIRPSKRWGETPPIAVLPGPNDPNNNWATCCKPGGPSHEEAK